ncbi:type II CAAX endopeptidase family protein [Pedobacter antarcticus]|uniref:CPBP family intramembrane glutamic endopeptidase n=1 Tax=Pedobacter antarcticus TaxID=34086 RepID=UPI0029313C50|nr:type II CAAX endopeptidase family protein [Pedobacter antarcticus]
MEHELRSFWRIFFEYNWKFAVFLTLLICVPRFILVLNANASGNYSAIGLVMLASALAPIVFLTKTGRKNAGITKPKSYIGLLLAFIVGLAFSFLLYFAGYNLYGNTDMNWYQYIGRSYRIPAVISLNDKAVLFSVVAVTSMIFSPVGEELFFRGIVHSGFAKSIGDKKASAADSLIFAIVHISHFGIIYNNGHWDYLIAPGLIWFLAMFLISLLFFLFRRYTGSILGSIACHAAFNLGMTYCIFYLL